MLVKKLRGIPTNVNFCACFCISPFCNVLRLWHFYILFLTAFVGFCAGFDGSGGVCDIFEAGFNGSGAVLRRFYAGSTVG